MAEGSIRFTVFVPLIILASLAACSETPPNDVQIVTSVSVSPAVDTLVAVGATVQLSVQAQDQNGGDMGGTATWTSSATATATVDGSGLVSAVANGSATVTATIDGVAGTAMIVVEIPPPPAPTPWLAILREDAVSGDDWIYMLDPETGADTLLHVANVGPMSINSDQSAIVYNDEDADTWDIVDIRTGTTSTVFTCTAGCPDGASWSWTGDRIALLDPDDNTFVVVDTAGTVADTITLLFPPSFNTPIASATFDDLSWAPDGSEIAARCEPNGSAETICAVSMATDSVRVVRAIDLASDAKEVAWSPQGDWIAFVLNPDVGDPEIAIIRPDGSDEQSVATLGAYDDIGEPTWSPDGTQIAYECHPASGDPAICVVDVATGDTSELAIGSFPRWAN